MNGNDTDGDGTERLIIGWTCDDCDESIGDGPDMWDLAERLRKEHETESGHTTTVEVVEEQRILPSQSDRMDLDETMLEIAKERGDRIDWICPECQRSGEELETTKRCPDCDERLREVLPDGGAVESDVICRECETDLELIESERDAIGWWLSYECPSCGATGHVEERKTGTMRYDGCSTTARRLDALEREMFDERSNR